MENLEPLSAAYRPLLDLADGLTEEQGWIATRLPGWTVRDLLVHLTGDCQRALVALGTPSGGPVDTDAVSYWTAWQPESEAAQSGRRAVRVMASVWTSARGPAALYAETARAVLALAGRADPGLVVRTQGRTLTAGSLLSTLAVEATVHHLDVGSCLPQRPDDAALAETRRVLDGLLGAPAPAHWDPVRYVLLGTGRQVLDPGERAELGDLAARLPLFG